MITLHHDVLKFDITGILGFEINQHKKLQAISAAIDDL